MDDEDASARAVLGVVHHGRREPDEAILELQAAVDLNPSSAFAHLYLGTVLLAFGKAEEAMTHSNMAIRLSPHDPNLGVMITRIAMARFLLRDYEQAVEHARKALRYPGVTFWINAFLVSALAHLGRDEETERACAELLRRRPNFTCSFYKENAPAASPDLVASVVEGLRKAGVPE